MPTIKKNKLPFDVRLMYNLSVDIYQQITYYELDIISEQEFIEAVRGIVKKYEGLKETSAILPICLTVKYALAFEFRALVEKMQDCKIKNVIEIKSGELLQYWIECPKEKENDITDMAFMTWIKNPVFQKYYHDTRAFQEIADKYVSERCQQ